jgi:hypothetical protein|tara:strand:+ start:448 stop:630 length:183 start_codon:yes stop_codon:yes gene_type:complete
MPLRGLYLNFTMTENPKLSKNDLKWIKFNQKMAAMSGKKKLKKKDFFDALQEAHNEAYND